jgi:hypothetical protein
MLHFAPALFTYGDLPITKAMGEACSHLINLQGARIPPSLAAQPAFIHIISGDAFAFCTAGKMAEVRTGAEDYWRRSRPLSVPAVASYAYYGPEVY